MIDNEEWPDGMSTRDWLNNRYHQCAYPRGYLALYIESRRELHRNIQTEIDKLYAEAASDPEKWERLRNAKI